MPSNKMRPSALPQVWRSEWIQLMESTEPPPLPPPPTREEIDEQERVLQQEGRFYDQQNCFDHLYSAYVGN